ncbi:MlaD family protein [Patulibacter brassicae]|uniref:MlaD family protein n=1 Tax=Patulibacter brassicae TaxID=1705717 RepID=A0ABU4VMI5_9ACTN|nr:MlaD family protein [Patulibacter brassicae]MDX8152000.1 MlaD family protein [Patulibacter brassicae]
MSRGSRSLNRSVRDVVRSNVRWGFGVVLFTLVVVYLIFGGPIPFKSSRELTVITNDGGMLRVGAATKVRVAGVDIGNVTGIEPVGGGLSKITVKLKGDAPTLRRDATVKIRPRLFLEGNFFLDVNPGSPNAEPLGDHAIPPSATTIHVAFDEIFTALDSNSRRDFQRTLKGFGEGLEDGGAQAFNTLIRATPPALGSLAVVSHAAQGARPGDLRRLVRSTSDLVTLLDRHEDSLRGILVDGRRTFQAFADSQADLRSTFSELDRTTQRAMPALARLNAVVPEARALVRDARPLVRRLPTTLDLANPALGSALRLARSGSLQKLLGELRPTLASLDAAAGPLGESTGALRPVATCLWKNALPVLTGKVQDGALSTNIPVYQELLSAFVGLNSASQNFDANGPWIRYLVGFGNQALSFGGGQRTMAARADQPVIGSSPQPTTEPPFRPDVPCETQAVPELRSKPHAYVGEQRTDPIDKQAFRRTAEKGLKAIQGLDQRGLTQLQDRLEQLLSGDAATDGAPGTSTTPAAGDRDAAAAAASAGVGR